MFQVVHGYFELIRQQGFFPLKIEGILINSAF